MPIRPPTPHSPSPPSQPNSPPSPPKQTSPNPDHDAWKSKYDHLKAAYDDLRTEYELLQDKCNKMVNHKDATMEDDEDMFSMWHDDVGSEV
ncbi:hypothetical protein EG328_007489 [Venturia inaequalis]|uniref:Uncharacterized protein n=1 Tax=Venturia inaequalis TaxID=5025 RepID=A0A8H3VJ74_VENIN|nr:hypothetical protein EG328_007489 [Venturia inaequalis]KAE9988965.1 hypothetical protein EG327_003143 [Venturia inaequalis]